MALIWEKQVDFGKIRVYDDSAKSRAEDEKEKIVAEISRRIAGFYEAKETEDKKKTAQRPS